MLLTSLNKKKIWLLWYDKSWYYWFLYSLVRCSFVTGMTRRQRGIFGTNRYFISETIEKWRIEERKREKEERRRTKKNEEERRTKKKKKKKREISLSVSQREALSFLSSYNEAKLGWLPIKKVPSSSSSGYIPDYGGLPLHTLSRHRLLSRLLVLLSKFSPLLLSALRKDRRRIRTTFPQHFITHPPIYRWRLSHNNLVEDDYEHNYQQRYRMSLHHRRSWIYQAGKKRLSRPTVDLHQRHIRQLCLQSPHH